MTWTAPEVLKQGAEVAYDRPFVLRMYGQFVCRLLESKEALSKEEKRALAESVKAELIEKGFKPDGRRLYHRYRNATSHSPIGNPEVYAIINEVAEAVEDPFE